ncbi:MAG: PQQ-binding-like beta-propeller repeat protein [Cypionkella sp.]
MLSETNLNAPVYSTPVVANGVIYVASNSHLYAFHDSARRRGHPGSAGQDGREA